MLAHGTHLSTGNSCSAFPYIQENRSTMPFTELAIFGITAQTRVTGNQTQPLFKRYYCSVSPDKFPPRNFQVPTRSYSNNTNAAASSYVTARGNLILLPPRELLYIVCMHLWSQYVAFCELSLYISKNCDWLGEELSFPQFCKPVQAHTSPHSALSWATLQLVFYFCWLFYYCYWANMKTGWSNVGINLKQIVSRRQQMDWRTGNYYFVVLLDGTDWLKVESYSRYQHPPVIKKSDSKALA